MADASVTGSDGCVMKLQNYRGIVITPHDGFDKRLDEVQQLEARDDDVMICGYPKCGTNWVWEVVMMLLDNSSDYIKRPKLSQMLEFGLIPMSVITDVPSPRVFNTHLPFSYLPLDAIKKRNKIIYLLRNPKDVAVSYYHHTRNLKHYEYQGSWSAYFDLFAKGTCEFGSYFKYLNQWEQEVRRHPDVPIINIYYEDLKEDFMREARRLCEFLEISRDDQLLETVHDVCSFKKMKAAKEQDEVAAFRDGTSIYRKGGVGDWKNWFTVAQSEMLDRQHEDEMRGLDLKFKYVL